MFEKFFLQSCPFSGKNNKMVDVIDGRPLTEFGKI